MKAIYILAMFLVIHDKHLIPKLIFDADLKCALWTIEVVINLKKLSLELYLT